MFEYVTSLLQNEYNNTVWKLDDVMEQYKDKAESEYSKNKTSENELAVKLLTHLWRCCNAESKERMKH